MLKSPHPDLCYPKSMLYGTRLTLRVTARIIRTATPLTSTTNTKRRVYNFFWRVLTDIIGDYYEKK